MISNSLEQVIDWYSAERVDDKRVLHHVCVTRDVFQARLDTFFQEIVRVGGFSEDEAALLVAVAGEIGNNCFDHNLGQWPNSIGCWFSWDIFKEKNQLMVIISDRGRGILNSLRQIKPDLSTEREALHIAFEQKISGRAPEKRGNGLKFVRSVINHHEQRKLVFYSGSEGMEFGGLGDRGEIENKIGTGKMNKIGTGTFAALVWGEL